MRRLTGLLLFSAALLPAQPLKVLILTGQNDLPYHRWQETTAAIRGILERSGRFEVRVNEEPRALSAAALQGYAALILNYNGPRFPAEVEKAIETYVAAGGGLVAFHQASYGEFFGMRFENGRWADGPPSEAWTAFPKMIGASWEAKLLGHARRCSFTVDWKVPTHPVAQGLPASWVADDELYHKLTLFPGVQVLADALSPADLGGTGRREPMVWVNRFGQGRVFFTPLGHDALAWNQPGMQDTFARGVEWAASGAVTLKPVGPSPGSSAGAAGGRGPER